MLKKFSCAILALALIAAAAPAFADPAVIQGLDIWYTPSGGANVTVNIPGGFFCGGNSAPQTRTIALKGRPLVTNPAGKINPGDTVVDRPANIPFNQNGGLQGTGNLKIRALDLVSVQSFTVACPGGLIQVWNTEVSLNGPQALGTITIRKAAIPDRFGKFDASFPVAGKVRFRNAATGAATAALADNPTITTLDACWSHDPGPGAVVCAGAVTLDIDGDRVITAADYTSPYCTSNFFPGWTQNTLGQVIQCPVDHTGPHPKTCGAPGQGCPETTTSNPCTTDIVSYLNAHKVSDGFVLDNVAALNAQFSVKRGGGKTGGAQADTSGTVTQADPSGTITGTGTATTAERVAVTETDLGVTRVDRCIQAQGTAILNNGN
jgi:hypothetical protein